MSDWRPRLIASDMDGTLLRCDDTVSDATVAELDRWRDDGVPVRAGHRPAAALDAPASARCWATARRSAATAPCCSTSSDARSSHEEPLDARRPAVGHRRAARAGSPTPGSPSSTAGSSATSRSTGRGGTSNAPGVAVATLEEMIAAAGRPSCWPATSRLPPRRVRRARRGRRRRPGHGHQLLHRRPRRDLRAPASPRPPAWPTVAARHGIGPEDVVVFGDMPNDIAAFEWVRDARRPRRGHGARAPGPARRRHRRHRHQRRRRRRRLPRLALTPPLERSAAALADRRLRSGPRLADRRESEQQMEQQADDHAGRTARSASEEPDGRDGAVARSAACAAGCSAPILVVALTTVGVGAFGIQRMSVLSDQAEDVYDDGTVPLDALRQLQVDWWQLSDPHRAGQHRRPARGVPQRLASSGPPSSSSRLAEQRAAVAALPLSAADARSSSTRFETAVDTYLRRTWPSCTAGGSRPPAGEAATTRGPARRAAADGMNEQEAVIVRVDHGRHRLPRRPPRRRRRPTRRTPTTTGRTLTLIDHRRRPAVSVAARDRWCPAA